MKPKGSTQGRIAKRDLSALITDELPARPVRIDKIGRPIVVYTRLETVQQEETIGALLLEGVPSAAIRNVCRQRHGIGARRVDTMAARIKERWAREEEANRPTNRAAATRRCMGAIQRALSGVPQTQDGVQAGWRTPPDLKLALQYERLLADFQGTRAPAKVAVNVDARVTAALAAVIAKLTPEQIEERLARVREREEKVRRYDLVSVGRGNRPNPGLDAT